MTFAELKAALEKLTPEQLAKPVLWCGDDRGGHIDSFGFTEDDTILDEGDTGELFTRSDFERICREDNEPERFAKGVVTLEKGAPMLFTDDATCEVVREQD